MMASHHSRTRGRLLVLCSLPPLPARANGFSIRYAPILAGLTSSYLVDLALVMDWPLDPAEQAFLESKFHSVRVFARRHLRQGIMKRVVTRVISLLPGGIPYPLVAYDGSDVEAFLREEFGNTTYDLLIITSPEFAVETKRAIPAHRVVIDAVDSLTLLAQRAAGRSLLRQFDTYRVRQWERALCEKADYIAYISANDRAAAYGAHVPSHVGVIPNGLYLDDYLEPAGIRRSGAQVAFLGNMGYGPNVSAALRLAGLWPRVQEQHPEAMLSIIGRNPTPAISALQSQPGVEVTGTVDSIWPYLHRSRVACFPMTHGAGMQNKVLEAMWSECPVVTSRVGNNGIGGTDGVDLLLAETDDEFIEALSWVFAHPEEARRLGENGKRFVAATYSWERSRALFRTHMLGWPESP
jgi:glycosyltransferase involved in cell wall biosynthesis